MKLKKMIAACALTLCAVPFTASAELGKAEWQAKIGDCANNPAAMKATISQIKASEQAEFVGRVNEAIGKMPGTPEAKSAAFYVVNKAAVRGATNKKSVLAEVFATVPVEYLTDINERFATELFGRDANRTYAKDEEGDGKFIKLAKSTLAVVNSRCESAKNAGVRQTFAALMFIRAADGSPKGLTDMLIAQMTDSQAKASASAWIAEALRSEGEAASYDSMLDAAGAEDVDHSVVLQMTGPSEVIESMLSDLQDPSVPPSGMGSGNFVSGSVAGAAVPSEDLSDARLTRVPRGAIGSSSAVGGNRDGTNADDDNPYYSRRRGSSSEPSSPFRPTPEPPDYVK